MMNRIISIYGIAYLVLLTAVLVLLTVYPKLELHMLLNSWHTGVQNVFFKYYSQMAEWPLYIIALLPLLWKKYRLTLFFAISELTAGALLQILKHSICTDRPVCAFENCQEMFLPLVDGVNMHHSNSFPSGHSSTFFVFCTCCVLFLAYHYRYKAKTFTLSTWLLVSLALIAMLILAALGAYSRIYLSQHFLSDVCVGSIIGFITPLLLFYFGKEKILKIKNEQDS